MNLICIGSGLTWVGAYFRRRSRSTGQIELLPNRFNRPVPDRPGLDLKSSPRRSFPDLAPMEAGRRPSRAGAGSFEGTPTRRPVRQSSPGWWRAARPPRGAGSHGRTGALGEWAWQMLSTNSSAPLDPFRERVLDDNPRARRGLAAEVGGLDPK